MADYNIFSGLPNLKYDAKAFNISTAPIDAAAIAKFVADQKDAPLRELGYDPAEFRARPLQEQRDTLKARGYNPDEFLGPAPQEPAVVAPNFDFGGTLGPNFLQGLGNSGLSKETIADLGKNLNSADMLKGTTAENYDQFVKSLDPFAGSRGTNTTEGVGINSIGKTINKAVADVIEHPLDPLQIQKNLEMKDENGKGGESLATAISNPSNAFNKAGTDISDFMDKPETRAAIGMIIGGPAGAVLGAETTAKGKEDLAKVADKAVSDVRTAGDKAVSDAKEIKISDIVGGSKKESPSSKISVQDALSSVLGPPTGGGAGPNGINNTVQQISNPYVNDTFESTQLGLLQQLKDQAAGKGMSLAQMQQKQASNKALQNTLGSVRAGLGSNAALTARTAALAGGNQMADIANQSAMLRLKEQQDAQTALANMASQGQAAQLARAGALTDVQKSNQSAQLAQQNMANQRVLAELDARTKIGAAAITANAIPQPQEQSIWPTVLSTGGAVVGGIYGGPAGATAGAAAGNAVGGQIGQGQGSNTSSAPQGLNSMPLVQSPITATPSQDIDPLTGLPRR